MKLRVTRVHQRYGISRYRVSFPTGLPFEFLIATAPRTGPTREWQALFARQLAYTLTRMAEYLELD